MTVLADKMQMVTKGLHESGPTRPVVRAARAPLTQPCSNCTKDCKSYDAQYLWSQPILMLSVCDRCAQQRGRYIHNVCTPEELAYRNNSQTDPRVPNEHPAQKGDDAPNCEGHCRGKSCLQRYRRTVM